MKQIRSEVQLRTAGLLGVVIAAGILCRGPPTPFFVHKDLADALWAMAIYLLVRLLFPKSTIAPVALVAAAIAFGIEFLKLVHAGWLETFRATWIGGVLLGRYFHGGDLLRCAAGITAAMVSDVSFRKRVAVLKSD